MQVNQVVEVKGNGINAMCTVYAVGFSDYRSDYIQVKHPNNKIYFVLIKNCKVI